MIAQYVVVGILVVIAAVYTAFKFVRVWKGKDSSCSTCKGCDLQSLKRDDGKSACPESKDDDK